MSISAFDLSELTIVSEVPSYFGAPPTPIYGFPVTPKEAYAGMLAHKPVWQITDIETRLFAPRLLPDNVAR